MDGLRGECLGAAGLDIRLLVQESSRELKAFVPAVRDHQGTNPIIPQPLALKRSCF